MVLRKKHIPPELAAPYQAFHEQVETLEAARRALMSCLPVGRVDPAPIAVGLDLLDDTLAELEGALDAWRVPPIQEAWQACAAAIAQARGNIGRAHDVAEASTELEELLLAVEDVDEPLGHAFRTAEVAWRRLRR